jgi:hypothetical protein
MHGVLPIFYYWYVDLLLRVHKWLLDYLCYTLCYFFFDILICAYNFILFFFYGVIVTILTVLLLPLFRFSVCYKSIGQTGCHLAVDRIKTMCKRYGPFDFLEPARGHTPIFSLSFQIVSECHYVHYTLPNNHHAYLCAEWEVKRVR